MKGNFQLVLNWIILHVWIELFFNACNPNKSAWLVDHKNSDDDYEDGGIEEGRRWQRR